MNSSQRKLTIENFLSASAFDRIANLAHSEAGIVLSKSKESMVKSRLTRRLRALKIGDFDTYLNFLENDTNADEISHFISALTTNVSHFFREEHHFSALRNDILPLLYTKLKMGQPVRIWSAGCSNGQEPYSIAMTLLEFDSNIGNYDIKILATDIDPEVLTYAIQGSYSGALTSGLPKNCEKYFTCTKIMNDEVLQIKPNVKNLVSFRQLNLHAKWPMAGCFDVIFCRNVVIYFDDETQSQLYRRFANSLNDAGYLLLGHSERLGEEVSDLFKNIGVTIYQSNKKRGEVPSQNRMERQ
ncbi:MULTISPECIES: CheR family methyltransferase [Pacificibacter]|uniref:CheR family methyltransferase n=1 Tax=Pacificibacter TaxID=1042323 RepID=UPI001C08D5D6|nr:MULTISPECIES: protein-glutamate O-methyltransferase CheR [Pacificibacter]MBU2935005.1 protein-glutamate O-methyltransferase CheR [Pacificibacter marinus]MDO6616359.1 protein-glutamate O-methyltransferase CheR [Pacificibacter sp. 1_MG-2023]